jgi:hypothetical protein
MRPADIYSFFKKINLFFLSILSIELILLRKYKKTKVQEVPYFILKMNVLCVVLIIKKETNMLFKKCDKIYTSEINVFLRTVSDKYSIPKTQLNHIWKGTPITKFQKYQKEPQTVVKAKVSRTNNVLDMLKNLKIVEHIIKDNNNHYIHPPTMLVFDPLTKKAVGRKNSNGCISSLGVEEIEICKQYKFDYYLPLNISPIQSSDIEKIQDEIENIRVGDSDDEPI